MKQGLSLRVSQHLALTPQLQQSIRLLQLSTLELSQEVEQMLDENPFLEVIEEAATREEFGLEHTDTPVSQDTQEFESAPDFIASQVYEMGLQAKMTLKQRQNPAPRPSSKKAGTAMARSSPRPTTANGVATRQPAKTMAMTAMPRLPTSPAAISRCKTICIGSRSACGCPSWTARPCTS